MLPGEEDSSTFSISSSFSSSPTRSCAVDCACTPSMETSSCTAGCGRTRMARALPPLLLLLHFISVHGVVIATNTTELTAALNGTAAQSDQDAPTDVSHAVTMGTGPGGSINTVTPRAGRVARDGGGAEEQELSSGMFGEAAVPDVGGTLSPSEISPDSVEAELLLPGNRLPPDVTEEAEPVSRSEPPWIHTKDTAVFDLDRPSTAAPAPPATNAAHPDILHVDFFDPASRGRNLDLGPRPTSSLAHELQGGDPTSWAMPDSYDYLTPYDEGGSPTADKYPDTTTDNGGSPARPASFLPNGPRRGPPAPAPAPVDGSDGMGGCRPGYQMINATCRSPCDFDPNFCYNGGQCYLLEDSGTFCRCNVQDYIWHKGARCEAVVTEFQVMCLAVGASAVVVLLLFMMVVCFAKKLHVLKTENKKLRRRSKYRPTSEAHNDNFSLSTIAEGSHPNKTMSRYTWECKTKEESDCEDDPNSQNKLEEPLKAPPKEDDALNIHNALTPKHDNHKLLGDDDSEVNSLQNNMM
ncbi:chondroitin sulfate proteoglycan 5-like isoform X2 [Syngnathoides biaculeatus]|uniref:chondroitin sulfate proteoglycan 5-like isoform X2 n=1 Tax=Syngnathoides biaculeatus TaxID=300417 RepID=UPI002ADD588B|nr:chondroitin sulfate proteoglycan 5-like isoform X2 [Syngnathoides biaculeatus]